MYPKGWKRQLMEAMVLLVALSYAARLAAAWLGAIIPTVLVVICLVGVYTLVFRGWRR